MRISDWSSDVCSSDLPPVGERLARVVELRGGLGRGQAAKQHDEFLAAVARDMAMIVRNPRQRVGDRLDHAVARLVPVEVVALLDKIGRASCRERVCQYM